ncbi:MAG: sigma-70 family RNA polymerase sigma factor [Alicyclobacillus mali]|uniref:RNA polymerase sigma factor n=1 Tax=Alicyclobacillus mali (ex Roth et al. 2021) TaxID=1123961 RepID=UPI0023F12EFB|nr:sigma-70 family RNA polymerase sigma factor [Alicyclobacillus mali (ex Roth et al. 2021)]MCL6488201.1 sigma-70 family RNA polymerase sigma factor [Alicyclobacillus mali (ex Roth et al. 2021)]
MVSDEELMMRVAAGDADALQELYQRHAPRVTAIARNMIRDSDAVKDVVQDVFLRVWRTRSYNPALGPVAHWLAVVTRHIAVDHLRRAKPHKQVLQLEVDPRAPSDAPSDAALLRADLARALRAIRAEERDVVVLAYVHGMTLREIAERLQIPLGTVKTRLHRGLRGLRQQLAEYPEVEP